MQEKLEPRDPLLEGAHLLPGELWEIVVINGIPAEVLTISDPGGTRILVRIDGTIHDLQLNQEVIYN